ncbi:MAG: sugar phosphate nucleotidyltransferase [Deferrisomatales bacterium]|nr:sugar phosphate nucleotidyltransferase [Deferrisomatales bacterium]
MKAVLMAGGFGTRIQPLTQSVPKPMVPLVNRPMMEHIVVWLREAGITEIVVLLYYMPEVIQEYFGDGSRFGVNLTYVLPDDDYGTAGAVKCAERHLDSTFLLCSGDVVTDFDLAAILAFHRTRHAPVTITLTSVPDPLQFGVVITDAEGRILRFLEKPGWGEVFSDTVNTGIYVLEPEVFQRIPPGRAFDFSKDLFPTYLRDDVAIYGCKAEGYWRDVGDTDSYREALRDLLAGKVSLGFPGTRHATEDGTLWVEPGAAPLPADLTVQGCAVVGSGARLGPGVVLDHAVIGPGARVGAGAHLSQTTLWSGVEVGAGAVLHNVVLCDGVQVGDGVRMEKGAVVAEGTEVGDRARFEKDLLVWPDKRVEADSVLSANLVWGDKWKKSVFEGGAVHGRTNVELSPEFSAKLGAALGSTLPRDSHILVGRDYLKASRMLKRAFLGGILSTGVNVHDVKMLPVPVMRYKLTSFGEVAGVYFQQSPTESRGAQVVFYDGDGNVIDSGLEKAIERLFFKENFRRVDHSEVGAIQELQATTQFYREGYLRALDVLALQGRRYRVVLDLGNGTTGEYLPPLLNTLGCETVVLNTYPDERRLMRRMHETRDALQRVSQIVSALNADVGFYLTPGGQNLYVVDDRGRVFSGHDTLLCTLKLLAAAKPLGARVFLPVTAPHALERVEPSLRITRGKSSGLKTSAMHDMDLIAEADGKYAYPVFLHGADAMFAAAKLLELLARQECPLGEVYDGLPAFAYRRRQLACAVERKGLAMRRMSEDSVDKEASFIDGVQVEIEGCSVLLLPDPHGPLLHLVVEGPEPAVVNGLAATYEAKVQLWIGS